MLWTAYDHYQKWLSTAFYAQGRTFRPLCVRKTYTVVAQAGLSLQTTREKLTLLTLALLRT